MFTDETFNPDKSFACGVLIGGFPYQSNGKSKTIGTTSYIDVVKAWVKETVPSFCSEMNVTADVEGTCHSSQDTPLILETVRDAISNDEALSPTFGLKDAFVKDAEEETQPSSSITTHSQLHHDVSTSRDTK